MQAGDVFYSPYHKFPDGGTSDKLLILLTDPDQSGAYYFVLATTKNKRNFYKNIHGCYANEWGGYYFLPEKVDWFNEDTWILFNSIREKSTVDILRESIAKRNLIEKGRMKEDNFRALIKCIRNSQDVKRGIKTLLPYSI